MTVHRPPRHRSPRHRRPVPLAVWSTRLGSALVAGGLVVASGTPQLVSASSAADATPAGGRAPVLVAAGTPVAPPQQLLVEDLLTQGSPDQVSTAKGLGTSARVLAAAAAPGAGTGAAGVPERVLAAYRAAEARLALEDPTCGLSWSLLAGVGQVESGHASGGRVDAAGRTRGQVLGPRLDGSMPGTAVITDSDDGALDGDAAYDRAVGPMQFLPGTWAGAGADADGDGRSDPHDVDDAALAAGRYLCADSGEVGLGAPGGQVDALMRYNRSAAYGQEVMRWAAAYRDGVQPVPWSPGAVPAAPTAPAPHEVVRAGSATDRLPAPRQDAVPPVRATPAPSSTAPPSAAPAATPPPVPSPAAPPSATQPSGAPAPAPVPEPAPPAQPPADPPTSAPVPPALVPPASTTTPGTAPAPAPSAPLGPDPAPVTTSTTAAPSPSGTPTTSCAPPPSEGTSPSAPGSTASSAPEGTTPSASESTAPSASESTTPSAPSASTPTPTGTPADAGSAPAGAATSTAGGSSTTSATGPGAADPTGTSAPAGSASTSAPAPLPTGTPDPGTSSGTCPPVTASLTATASPTDAPSAPGGTASP